MKRALIVFALALFALTLAPSTTFAAKPVTTTPELVGYDISYPQCDNRLPTEYYFGIVGVNGGNAANTNPCLAAQLAWANRSKGGTNQPKIQTYVNTANPGQYIGQITTWPTSNTDKTGFTTQNPYGSCSGANDLPCSWQYGWNRSVETHLERFVPAAKTAKISQLASSYRWWLDVETMNTWQTASEGGLAKNSAAIEGFAAYYQSKGAIVGLYSTAQQWSEIVGDTVSPDSNLNGLGNWRPSGATLSNAITNCSVPPLTAGGYISLTQYVSRNIDHNHTCNKD